MILILFILLFLILALYIYSILQLPLFVCVMRGSFWYSLSHSNLLVFHSDEKTQYIKEQLIMATYQSSYCSYYIPVPTKKRNMSKRGTRVSIWHVRSSGFLTGLLIVVFVIRSISGRLIKFSSIEFFDPNFILFYFFKYIDFRLLARSIQIRREIKNRQE